MGCKCKNRSIKLEEGFKAMRWFDKENMTWPEIIWDKFLSFITAMRVYPKLLFMGIRMKIRHEPLVIKLSDIIGQENKS